MTHAELSRKRALRCVDTFIAALEEYNKTKFHPKDRGMFMKRDGIFRIVDSTALPPGILEDTKCLQEALEEQSSDSVEAILQRLNDADHDIPYSTKTDYPALYAESFNLSREYVEVSSLDLEDVDESQGQDEPPALKRPSDSALKAWRLRDLKGLETQKEIAAVMTQELQRSVTQGEVSRWLKDVHNYLTAGNILPDLPTLTTKPQSIDPSIQDMGERKDHKTPRQRAQRDQSQDN